jgi:hypothetical protein
LAFADGETLREKPGVSRHRFPFSGHPQRPASGVVVTGQGESANAVERIVAALRVVRAAAVPRRLFFGNSLAFSARQH